MRSHCALYVDVGYLMAAAATRVTGTSLRGGIEVDHKKLIDTLAAHAADTSGLPLLRVNWYDAARNGMPDQTQQKIGLLPRVKVRLGRIGFDGEQKGVDLRIGLDMVAHARNAAIDVIFLVTGDDDLTQAVEEAQAHGVQVIVLAVPSKGGAPHSVSQHLQRASDGLDLLDGGALDAAVTPRPGITAKPEIPPAKQPIARPGPGPHTPCGPDRTSDRDPDRDRQPTRVPARAHPRDATPVVSPTPANTPDSPTPAIDDGLVYSSSTGGGTTIAPRYLTAEDVAEPITQVVNGVVNTLLAGITKDQRVSLLANRPSIPREVDRALLTDLSDRLGNVDLSDHIRHLLRSRFWNKVDSGPDI